MPSPLKLASAWRIVKDVDLDGIRRRSHERFELWVIANDGAATREVASLLAPGPEHHPWLLRMTPTEVPTPVDAPPLAAIIVTATAELDPALASARNALRAKAVPVVVVRVGDTGPVASAPRVGEDARVAVTGLDETARAPIASTLVSLFPDDRRLALARQFAGMRAPVFHALIKETAQANARFAFTTGLAESVPILSAPLALGDILILTKNQVILSYRIMLAAGRDGEPRKMIGEVLGILGGGLLFRQMARELVGLIPIAGLPLKIAVAYSGTWAIGRAMTLWAADGRTVTTDAVRTMMTEGMDRGKAVAQKLIAGRRTQPEPADRTPQPVQRTDA